MQEVRTGYTDHAWLAIGHLDQAVAESIDSMPRVAAEIQRHKKLYEEAILAGKDYRVPTMDLISLAGGEAKAGILSHVPEDIASQVSKVVEGVTLLRETTPRGCRWHAGEVPAAKVKAVIEAVGKDDLVYILAGKKVVRTGSANRKAAKATPTVEGAANAQETAPATLPAKRSADGCHSCGEKERFAKLLKGVADAPDAERLIILTTLSNLSPAYSLTSVILDQANAAAMAGYRVSVWMHEGADIKDWPETMHPNVEVARVVPRFTWKEDAVDDAQAAKVTTFLARYVGAMAPCSIISHDLLFQSWFLTAAKGIHDLGPIEGVRWWHLAHSGLGGRSAEASKRWRFTLPTGHRLVVLSEPDIARGSAHYGINKDRVDALINPRDPRSFMAMPPVACDLLGWSKVHMAKAAMVYPYSGERAYFKGVDKVINLFAAMAKQGASVKLLLLDSHHDHRSEANKVKLKAQATRLELPEDTLFFASDRIKNPYAGVPMDGVRSLMACSNLFAFPTVSEAGPLTLMEASQSGCQLVLNDDVPALKGYVAKEDAIWVPWGKALEKDPVDVGKLADQVLCALEGSAANRAKRRTLRENCLEAYGLRLRAALSKR
jgi:glycosyltransferase involved in cell wall biosynthesis